jgi:hypothetical protein
MTNQLEGVFQSLNSQQREIIGVDTLFYLAVKVENYLKIGPKEYALEDAFGYPDHTYSEGHLQSIGKVSQQLILGKGLTLQNPIDIYRSGVASKFLQTFHFKIHSKEYFTNKDEGPLFLASSSHVIDKRNLSLYFKINRGT